MLRSRQQKRRSSGLKQRNSKRSRLLERLEARQLLAADGVAPLQLADGSTDGSAVVVILPAEPFLGIGDLTAVDLVAAGFEQSAFETSTVETSTTPIADGRRLVFVDAGIVDYQALVAEVTGGVNGASGIGASAASNIEVVVLDANRDGVAQITEALGQYSDLAAVHVLSHGSAGTIQLGSTRLDSDSLKLNSQQMGTWGDAIRDGGDLLLYGCEVASGTSGIEFVQNMSQVTGVDVAASSDLTGAASFGGDWQLEYSTGVIEVSAVLDASSAAFFDGVLQMVPGDALNQAGNFSIRTDRIVVTQVNGGAQVDDVVFNDVNAAVELGGSNSADTFEFTGIPGLGNNRAASTLNGNGGANTIDVSAINKNLVFEINNLTAGANDNTKSVIKTQNGNDPTRTNDLAAFFPNIRNVQTFVGGRQNNTFKFSNDFSGEATVDVSAAGDDDISTLDFSQKQLALKIAVDNAGLLTVTDSNANQLVTTASAVNKVLNRGANDATLDLSGFANDELLSLTIKANNTVQVSFNGVTLVEVANVGTLKLGQGMNILAYEANGSIANIDLPGTGDGLSNANGLNTRVELNYSHYGASAQVNKGTAIDLRAGQGATLTPVNLNASDWRTETWRMSLVDNAGNATFTFGGDDTAANINNHRNVDLSIAGNIDQALDDILSRLAGVPVVEVVAENGNNPTYWDSNRSRPSAANVLVDVNASAVQPTRIDEQSHRLVENLEW